MAPLARPLRRLYRGWMRFAHALGVVNTAVLLALVYLLGFGPMRLFAFLRRDDALGRRRVASFWKPHAEPTGPAARLSLRERLRHQF